MRLPRTSCLVLAFALAPSLMAATYDNATSGHCDGGVSNVCTASATTLTFSHTTGSGSNRALSVVVCVAGQTATVEPAISTVTYAGVGLTASGLPKQFDSTGTNYYCQLWQLPNGTQPATGANNVIVVLATGLLSSFEWLQATAFSASGVDQTTTFSVTGSNKSASAGTSSTLTLGLSGASDLVFSVSCAGSDFTSTAQTQRTIQSGGGAGACGSMISSSAAGNTTALSDTISVSDSWIKVGAAFKDAGGGGPTPKHQLTTMGVGY